MIFARIVLIALCIVSAGLYVRVLLPPQAGDTGNRAEQTGTEGKVAEAALEKAAEMAPQAAPPKDAEAVLAPLPEDQMQLVLKTLAPELLSEDR